MNMKKTRNITLKQLLLWFTGLLMLTLLVVNFFLNVTSARDFTQRQLSSHSSDAATSLGLSLSSVAEAKDIVVAGSMIDAIFDSGYYRHIILYDIDGGAKVVRHAPVKIEGVPEWFVNWIELETPEGKAEVVNGWMQLGSVSVVSNPGHAYVELWNILKAQLIWYALIGAVAFLMMQFMITTILLPLMRIEKQAKAVQNRDFSYRAPLPKTRELRRVSVAMNSMSDRLEQMFGKQLSLIEHLRTQSFQDSVTGLGNRAEFDKRLKAELESEQSAAVGSLILIQFGDFSAYNQTHGRQAGDKLLSQLAVTVKAYSVKVVDAFIARRSGSDFSIFLPGIVDDQADNFANGLLQKLTSLDLIKQMCRHDVLHIGIASTLTKISLPVILSEADMADIAAHFASLPRESEQAASAPESVGTNTDTAPASAPAAENSEIISSTPASVLYAGNVAAGKTKAAMCAACHGSNGNSLVPIYPSLAGQSANYIAKQLADFKSGNRKDPVMAGMVAALTAEDMNDLAAYFAVQSAKPGTGEANESGHKLYLGGDAAKGVTACVACHGVAGKGMKQAGFPSVTGQNKDYLKKQLASFRDASRGNDNNGIMRNIAIKLSDADIEAVAQYISSMK